MKNTLILFIAAALFTGCIKDPQPTVKPLTQWGDPDIDSLIVKTANRIGGPEPAPNYVFLTNVTVTNYEVDFSWIWGPKNFTHGGGGITLAHINVSVILPNHGGFSITSANYTTYPSSAIVTLTIMGNNTYIRPTRLGIDVIVDPQTTVIVAILNTSTGYFNLESHTKK